MKIHEINESKYSNAGGNRLAEERWVVYDLKAKAFIERNSNNQTGISRRGSITSGVSWFRSYEQAEEFLRHLHERLTTTEYKEGDQYTQRGTYRYNDRTITLTAKQARSKNNMMEKRRADIEALVISTVRATY